MAGLIDFVDTSEPTAPIDDDMIRACADEAQLRTWHQGLEDLAEMIRAEIAAYALGDGQDDDWLRRASRKMAWITVGRGRIRRRIRELGGTDNLNPVGRELEAIRQAHAQLRADAGLAIRFHNLARDRMNPVEFKQLETEALEKMERKLAAKAAGRQAYRVALANRGGEA